MKLWIPLACLAMVLAAGLALWTDRAGGQEPAASPHASRMHFGEDRSSVDGRSVEPQERGSSLIRAEVTTTRQSAETDPSEPATLASREAWFLEAERWQKDLAEALHQGESPSLEELLSAQLPTKKE